MAIDDTERDLLSSSSLFSFRQFPNFTVVCFPSCDFRNFIIVLYLLYYIIIVLYCNFCKPYATYATWYRQVIIFQIEFLKEFILSFSRSWKQIISKWKEITLKFFNQCKVVEDRDSGVSFNFFNICKIKKLLSNCNKI